MDKIFFILAISIYSFKLFAQPLPCGIDPKMQSFCNKACIICDIDGFKGTNSNTVSGEAPPGFCTGQVHNMKWIAFIAGTTNLEIELSVLNCKQGLGLEVGIYEGINCTNYRRVSECDTDIPENTKRIFKNTVPLVVGQYYFWVMDGSNNDICDYSIKVLKGSTKVAPLNEAAPIVIPDLICENKEVEFSTPGITGATIYDWYVDDKAITSNTKMKYTFPKAGEYNVCLDARNVCDSAPKSCKKIKVSNVPRDTLRKEVCFNDCLYYEGKEYCETRMYNLTYKASNGCDSILTLDLKVKDQIIVNQKARICELDTFVLGNYKFTSEGNHTAFIENAEGCKVKVNLELQVIKCNIKTEEKVTNVSCFDAKDGKINFRITNGTGPFNYTWEKIENNSVNGKGLIANQGDLISLSNMDEGNYYFIINDNFGNATFFTIEVKQPKPLIGKLDNKKYNGFGVSCFGANDGEISLDVQGGNPGYNYDWNNGAKTPGISNLKAGDYSLTITDQKGCKNILSYNINSPSKIEIVIDKLNANCSDINSGSLSLKNTKGGLAPYLFSLNGAPLSSIFEYKNLSPIKYLVTVQDANGCSDSQLIEIEPVQIPVLKYNGEIDIELGDSIALSFESNLTNQDISWTPKLKCDQCFENVVFPVNNAIYEVVATSKDGCTDKATFRVNVKKNYTFTISNIVSLNNDGLNDYPMYFADKAVSEIIYLDFYDRWGNKVYSMQNGVRGLNKIDWDGTLNGKNVISGNYTWHAKVKYLDDFIKNFFGSFLILR